LLDRRTGMCTDYQNRHDMCRSYGFCEHPKSCESIWCACHPIIKCLEPINPWLTRLLRRLPLDTLMLHG
jgi:hypothetical protein